MTGEKWLASGATLYAFQWDCDAVGNRSHENDDGAERYYTCDAANQLARVHQLPAVGTCLACDAKGNCLRLQESDGTIYFAYNYSDANLVTEIKYKDNTMNYFAYDALSRGEG